MASSQGRVSPFPRKNNAHWFDEDIDDDERPVSPAPSDRNQQKSGTHYLRFFPELSTHFTLTSPSNETSQAMQFPRTGSPLVNSHEARYPSESTRQTSSSLSSSELFDHGSSCYSRRSSITSHNSDPGRFGSKSVENVSLLSPAAAGVFDDAASARHIPPSPLKKKPTLAELKDKPLPLEPIIQLAPLSVRRSPRGQPGAGDGPNEHGGPADQVRTGKQKRGHHPTLSQAADDLESALSGFAEQPARSPNSYKLLDEPLQISRGNMDMIPTRRAPPPPIDVQRSEQLRVAKSREDLKPKKTPKNKMPFTFNLPSFGKKSNKPDSRSPSSCGMRPENEIQPVREVDMSGPKELEYKFEPRERYDSMELPVFMEFEHPPRPSFEPSERELRLQLPRLQTNEICEDQRAPSRAGTTPIGTTPIGTTPIGTTPVGTTPVGSMSPGGPVIIFEKDQDDVREEKIFISSSKDTSTDDNAPCEPEPLMLPSMVFELDGDFPEPKLDLTFSVQRESLGTIPSHLPDKIVLLIMEHACSLDDLFHLAVIDKQFYRVFKYYELRLMKNTVLTVSPPAWELREMSPAWDCEWQLLVDPDAPVPEYTPFLYLQRYAQDIFTLAQLKSLILAQCDAFLRPETKSGLLGVDEARALAVDDAFWRIWTFCRIFGCGKNREGDITGQMDWLDGGIAAVGRRKSSSMSVTEPFGMDNVLFDPPDGFGHGNKGGLSRDQLYDMTELWTCLGVLLQPLHGMCREAREAGIFEGHDAPEEDPLKEEVALEEWTYFILSLGPSAVLNVGLACFTDSAAATFQRARSLGLTKWEEAESGVSRFSFLKEAVSRGYRPRESTPPRGVSRSSNGSSNGSQGHASQKSTDSNGSASQVPNHRRRQVVYAEQLRNQKKEPQGLSVHPNTNERPISNYGAIMHHLEGHPHERRSPSPAPPATASQVPSHSAPHTQRLRVPSPSAPSYQPQVRDPVDKAIAMMVGDLGYHEEDAKWALKVTDTGEGIDVNAAVTLLMREHQNFTLSRDPSLRTQSNSLFSSVITSRESVNTGWRWV
ncbi:hypothetical protein P170DRAFT_475689 [Aspergillus steynii IBT 23096]|uniref:F-box domain protein n=1 Tax=Aspergillus steynii IBT 23096 TaxID=1392250 RepID=A0A2I2G977_9EURO|nr:uncharacterized protein P170DRAFT_475689 [Aspergillus steynii IBT 23096]PLB49393.1 hypothetical protein P170DRAFT_475689 [Aspergillus steynii IBT 23096]